MKNPATKNDLVLLEKKLVESFTNIASELMNHNSVNDNMEENDDILTRQEVLKTLKISGHTLRKLISENLLRGVAISTGKTLYRRSDIEAYISTRFTDLPAPE
jgi:predicted DNA-binding transcriptional regulator AlpA